MKEQFSLLAEQCSFDESTELDTVQFSRQMRNVK